MEAALARDRFSPARQGSLRCHPARRAGGGPAGAARATHPLCERIPQTRARTGLPAFLAGRMGRLQTGVSLGRRNSQRLATAPCRTPAATVVRRVGWRCIVCLVIIEPMKRFSLSFSILIVALTTVTSASAATSESDIRKSVSQSLSPHPRLMLTAKDLEDLKKSIASDSLQEQTWKLALAEADRVTGLPPLQRVLEGKRLLAVSRECLSRVMHLSLAWRMTGDAKYLNRARDEMLNVCRFENWNPSHFLDVAEMTTALAIGYDWLYDGLNEADRATIRHAIVDKGIKASQVGRQTWITLDNNWNQVCNGGMAMGMLAIAEDEPALAAEIVTRSINGLPYAMKQYAPDGAYPEGPGYWSYGTTYNVMLIASLESALGTDFGLADAPGFLATAEYFLQMTGP